VHRLERQLGTALVRYEQRRIRLTPAGEQVYRRANRMLRDERDLRRDIRAGLSGQVSLGVSVAFEHAYLFDRMLAPFRRAHPEVLISVRFGRSLGLAEQVLDHRLDLGYVIGWHIPIGVRFEPLHSAKFMLLVARSHALAERETVTAEEVAEAGLITAPLNDVEWVHYDKMLCKTGISRRASPVLEIGGMQARLLAARAGMGAVGIFLPPYARMDDPTLRPLRLGRPAVEVPVGLVHRQPEPTGVVCQLARYIRRLANEGPE
jgi:LysR family transcriptional regulator, transcriptional activator of the cysJI operon